MITAALIEEPTGYRAVLRTDAGSRLYAPEVRGLEIDAVFDAQDAIERIEAAMPHHFLRRRA